jgi:hypothetical protein
VQIVRQRQKKKKNTAPTTLIAIQAASQSTFINAQIYSIISQNDKNKQLTLLSQSKLAFTGKKYGMSMALQNKNSHARRFFRPRFMHLTSNAQYSCDTVPLRETFIYLRFM